MPKTVCMVVTATRGIIIDIEYYYYLWLRIPAVTTCVAAASKELKSLVLIFFLSHQLQIFLSAN